MFLLEEEHLVRKARKLGELRRSSCSYLDPPLEACCVFLEEHVSCVFLLEEEHVVRVRVHTWPEVAGKWAQIIGNQAISPKIIPGLKSLSK